MEMEDALTGLLSDIGNDAVALQSLFLGQLCDDLENMGHHAAVGTVHLGHGGDMGLGDHQKMDRGLGRDVAEGLAKRVLIDLGAGDLAGNNLAE